MTVKRIAWTGAILALGLLAGASCKSGSPTAPTPPVDNTAVKDDPSFAADIQSIFSNSCALSGCHGASAAGGLILIQGQSYANLVNVKSGGEPDKVRAIPNDATNSYIVIKVEGRQSVGSKMPLSGTALSANQIQNIKNWISKGAKNN